MAKWNRETTNKLDAKEEAKIERQTGIYMFHCLSTKKQQELEADWRNKGGLDVCPFWKYCFDNIKVSYTSK